MCFIRDCEPSPLEVLQEKEAHSCMADIIRELPWRQQVVIRAVVWDGKTYAEVGRELGKTRACIRQWYCKGERMLRHPDRLKPLGMAFGRWYE